MFGQLLKYNLKRAMRRKELIFWNLAFPIGLGTLFFLTFGNYTNSKEILKDIPVAYVEDNAADSEFESTIDDMQDGEDSLLIVIKTNMEDAEQLLEDGEVTGIYYNSEELKLYVNEEGIYQSILQTVLQEYEKMQSTITKIGMKHPENLEVAIAVMTSDTTILVEENYTSGSMDVNMEYFYALIAMSCLYGCYLGLRCAVEIKADLSTLAARRVVGSTNRFVIMLSDLLASIVMQFATSMLAVLYLRYVLGIQMGNKMLWIALTVLIGGIIGITTGLFIGSIGKAKESIKTGITLGVVMSECFLSGLMVENMYYVVEDFCPLLNRINPAALIVDSLYSLNIYDTYERYSRNMLGLLAMAVLLCIGSFAAIRRERYASI